MQFRFFVCAVVLGSSLLTSCSRQQSAESAQEEYSNPEIEHLRSAHGFNIGSAPTDDLRVVRCGEDSYQINFSEAGIRKLPPNAWPVIQMCMPDGPGTQGDVERVIAAVDGAIHQANAQHQNPGSSHQAASR